MNTDRKILRDELNKRILPILFSQGFKGKFMSGNSRSYDFVRQKNSSIETFIFIFDKYGQGSVGVQLEVKHANVIGSEKSNSFTIGHPYRKKCFRKVFLFRSKVNLLEKILGKTSELVANSEVLALENIMPLITKWWLDPNSVKEIETYNVAY